MNLRRVVALPIAALATSLTVPAFGQTIAISAGATEASLPRLDKEGNQIGKRPLQLTPEAVSLQDCVDDQKIRFPIAMSGFTANAIVQVWGSNSGASCTDQQSRSNPVARVCWKLLDSDIPLLLQQNVDIPVRNIMAGALPNNPATGDLPEARREENTCGKINLSTITVHFLYFAPGNEATAATDKQIGITVDTVGPAAPSGLSALPGDTRIQVRWVNISGGNPDAGATGGLTELTGVKVYCDVAGSAADAGAPEPVCHDEEVDGGLVEVCEDAGTPESPDTPQSGECTSANLVPGVFPTAEFNAKFECGSIVGNAGTSVVATSVGGKPLQNGVSYAVAVASTDKFGNVGELSPVVCMTPEVTTDFWDDYRKAGGKAGGGCATNGSAIPSFAVGGLGVFATLAAMRRRHRRTKSSARAPKDQAR